MEQNKPTAPQLLTRRLSNPSIRRLISESFKNPLSPMTPSPEGSSELRSILQRLEMMEIESRDLLQRLFSMVQTDARLEKYIRKRLQDPKVSRIWELIEQILASQLGNLDIETMLNRDDGTGDGNGVDEFHCVESVGIMVEDKGVKRRDDGVKNERFKVRQFDTGEAVVAQPNDQTVKK